MRENKPGYIHLEILIAVIAFLLGCVFIFLIKPFPGADFAVYQRLGWNLSQGNGFSDSPASPYAPMGWRTPLYPVFLALFYKFYGLNNTVVFLAQAFLHALSALFLVLIAKELFSKVIAYTAGFLFALYPVSAYWVGVLYNETLATFLLILITYFLLKYSKQKRSVYLEVAFFCSALSMLNRPVFALYPFFIVGTLLVGGFKIKEIILKVLMGLIVIGITLSPWIIRNYSTYKKFIPLVKSSGSGFSFYVATIEFRNGWDNTRYTEDPLFIKQIDEIMSQGYIPQGHFTTTAYVGTDKIFYEYALKNIKEHPFLYLSGFLKRLIRLYVAISNPTFGHVVIWLNIVVSGLLLFFAIIGILIFRAQLRRIVMLLLPIFYLTLAQLPFLGTSRYTIPVRPYLMVLVAVTLVKAYDKIKGRKIYD